MQSRFKVPDPPPGNGPVCLRLGCRHGEASHYCKIIRDTAARLRHLADNVPLDELETELIRLARELEIK